MKYHLITYGCQMNTADSEEMAQPLQSRGLTAASNLRDADIVLV
jgi:tRNA-2-methylthio-N6-dimethylallyladenosine synthase